MATIATLVVRLDADIRGYESSLKSAASTLKSFNGGIGANLAAAGKGFLSFGSIAGEALLGVAKYGSIALSAIGTGVAALGTKSFLEAARVDELKVVNEQLAQNAGIASAVMRAEVEEVKSMGIEAAISENAVSEFIRANLELAKASDIARIAQDSAVISGTNSSEAFASVTEGIMKFNPEILRTQGIIVNGAEAFANYAESIGVSAEDLTNAQKQQAYLNAVIEQGAKIAGTYEAAMKEPGKVLRSFPRYFNDIFVVVGEKLKPAFGEIVFGIAEFAKKLGSAVQDGGALSPLLERIGDAIMPLARTFGAILKNADFSVIAQKIEPVIVFFERLFDVANRVIGVLAWPRSIFAHLEDGQGILVGILEAMGMTKEQAVDMAVKIKDAFDWLVNTFNSVKTAIENDKGILVALFAAIAVSILTVVVPAVITLLSTMLPIIATFAAVAAVAYLVYSAWTQNWGGIRDKLTAFWEWLKAFIAWIKPAWDALWAGIVVVFNFVWAQIKTLWEAFSLLFQGDFYGFGEKLREGWDRAWQAITAILKTAWEGIKTIVKNLIQNVIDFFKNVDWGQVGKNIILGIANGILNGISAIVDAARKAAKAALDAAKGFLGIKSPSEVFQNIIGKNMALGLVAGFENTLMRNPLKPAMAGMTAGAVGASARLGATGGNVSNSSNTTVIVNNPQPERASDSVRRELTKLNYVGIPK